MNCFKFLLVSSLLLTGHLPSLSTLLFRIAVSFLSLLQGFACGLVELNKFWFSQTTSNTLKMGMESVLEMSENPSHLDTAGCLRKLH
jgi:hypothetical protein